jgi:hypothetical protein
MGQGKIEGQDFKSYAYAVFRCGCYKSEHQALRKLKRDGTVQAWRQKTIRAIKLKIS